MARYVDVDVFEVVGFENKSEDFVEGARYILEMIDEQATLDIKEVINDFVCKLKGESFDGYVTLEDYSEDSVECVSIEDIDNITKLFIEKYT